MRWKKTILGIFFLLLLLGIDQISKYLAVLHLKNQQAFSLISGVFELQYLENHGAAFGVMQNQRALLLMITVVILVVLAVLYYKLPMQKRYVPLRCVGICLAAGAIGNLLDRLVRGYVVDFFYVKLIDFPVFNVADCYVVVSAVAAFYLIAFYYDESELKWADDKKGT